MRLRAMCHRALVEVLSKISASDEAWELLERMRRVLKVMVKASGIVRLP